MGIVPGTRRILADIVDRKTRSRMMSRIRGRDTSPEVTLRRALHKLGFRYRTHSRALPGRPDLTLRKYRAVVFVHGCFWHHHRGCRFATNPSSNTSFWREKFEKTTQRDVEVLESLVAKNWRVAIVWECALEAGFPRVVRRLESWLRSSARRLEIAKNRKPDLSK